MKVRLINLDKRTDRLERAIQELKILGIDSFERFSAYSEPSAVKGNGRSHYECLQDGANLIFEDDIFCLPGAKENFEKAKSQLPEDWGILYLGGNIQEPLNRFSDNLYRCTFAWGSFAILYNDHAREFVLKHYNPNAEKFIIYDEWLRIMSAASLKAYICSPLVISTYGGISDVNGYYSDYSKMMRLNSQNFMR